ncbi:MAG: tRNA (N(6)-L-threonylcarbamoyladenosine(37)-C(2))-methylthiotransferase MtaB [Dehalococcoidia bacterium]|nr:tRNA (N(6)-L-threonylcarbamoyladenosine(37)-C(2))-methylthiotransferase MtaB [Dehalococcoidia bacterium]
MPQSIRVSIETLGCKLNQAESETLARQLMALGCSIVPPTEQQDVYILNTCTVTHIADRKVRHLLRLAKRRNPQVFAVAIGCYANRAQALSSDLIIDLVLGNDAKQNLPEIIREKFALSCKSKQVLTLSRTRAFVKVQDGCNGHCSYCIVPLVRGSEKSEPVQDVLSEIRQRVEEGYREVVLTGTEIGSYAADGQEIQGLLRQILSETAIERLRVSSLQPHEITPELIALWRNPCLCQHFHISLQSGADSVLRRMRRAYNTKGYRNALALIKESLPHAAITTDIIVGFPGETDDEFRQTVDFCRNTGFARIHVFPYSARPKTETAAMQEQVSTVVKKERVRIMLALAKEEAEAFHLRFVGHDLLVLWEQCQEGVLSGYTSQYIRVYADGGECLPNTISYVKMIRIHKDGLWGEIISDEQGM